MTRISTDYENNAEEFWGHLTSYDVIHTAPLTDDARLAAAKLIDSDVSDVVVSDETAAELVGWFRTLPGWVGGPAHAPHPLTTQPA